MKMFETKYFIVLLYAFLDKSAICIIDKKTKKSFLAFKKESGVSSKPSLTNDIDGGMPFNENVNYFVENDKEYFTQLINPFELKSFILTSEFKNSSPKYPEKKKDLEKLVNSLKETDNPVLMMVKLKK